MPASARKPPVPQRCISLDAGNGGGGGMGGRPSLPRNKKPQLTAEQLRPVHHGSVPNFNQNRNDMGKRMRLSLLGQNSRISIVDRVSTLVQGD